MANIFDKEVEIKTLKVNDKIIRYNKETYPRLNYTCFVINCPKYLHQALRSRYGSKYGVDVCNDNHLSMTNENGIAEVYKEIEKGKEVFAKYHKGQTVEMSYDLEYGSATIEMHKDSIKPGQKVVLVDDLIATGGTIEAAAKLVEELGGEVVKIIFLMELAGLEGRKKLAKYDVGSVVCYEGK